VTGIDRVRPSRDGRRWARPPTVLVLAADERVADYVEFILAADGRRVVHGDVGLSGVETAKSIQPALILLDLRLRGRDGRITLRALKGNPITADIPVVITAAGAGALPDEDRALTRAMLQPPYSTDQLRAIVARTLGAPT
jgi:CheY-like chemotaxis protein